MWRVASRRASGCAGAVKDSWTRGRVGYVVVPEDTSCGYKLWIQVVYQRIQVVYTSCILWLYVVEIGCAAVGVYLLGWVERARVRLHARLLLPGR